MTDNYRFWLKTDIRIGPETSLEAVNYVRDNKLRKIAVIVDHGVMENQQLKKFLKELKKTKAKIQLEIITITEADYDFLDNFRKKFNRDIELFIGIGGGSILDVTKGMSVLLVNRKPAIEYRGFGKIVKAGPPIIAIPTTAGTGSEVTPNASFIDKKEMKKMGINTDLYLPKLALLDPLLTLTCPKSITIGSAMDALIHALEAYTAKVATPISRIFSVEAINIIMRDLPKVIKNPTDVALRQNLLKASFLAGIAMINSGTGLTAALSYPLGVHFRVPHGMAGAVYLSKAVRLNYDLGAKIYNELGKDFVKNLEQMSLELDIPQKITHFGVTKKDLPLLTNELLTFTGALAQNPVKLNKKILTKFMKSMV